MIEDKAEPKIESWLTGHAQNVHKEVKVDRSIDRPDEAAAADGVDRPPGRLTEMPELTRELTLCVFTQWSTARSTAARSQ